MYSATILKQLRKENKIKMKDIAEKMGVTVSYYWQLENGRKRLFYDRAVQIALIFNMKPDELFYADYRK